VDDRRHPSIKHVVQFVGVDFFEFDLFDESEIAITTASADALLIELFASTGPEENGIWAHGVEARPVAFGWLDVAGWVVGDVLPRDGGDEGTVGQRVECCAGMRM
jgi:hypothetical protein